MIVVIHGLGDEPETQALVARLLAETSIPVVLDADGLRPGALAAAVAARPRGGLLLTPHDGEAARLGIPVDPAWSLADEAACLAAWAAERAAVLVRKGPATRVVGPGGSNTMAPKRGRLPENSFLNMDANPNTAFVCTPCRVLRCGGSAK